MAKEVTGYIKLQIPTGKATPAPPVGPTLGQHSINIIQFTKEFSARTVGQSDMIIPVVITVYVDRSFSFIIKVPSATALIRKACNIKNGSGIPNGAGIAILKKADLQEIAETKIPGLNTASLGAVMNMVADAARSMGVTVEG